MPSACSPHRRSSKCARTACCTFCRGSRRRAFGPRSKTRRACARRKRSPSKNSNVRSIVIVGASLAGFSAAKALRRLGFDGTITVVGDELHLPYQRPPLSKQFLEGAWDRARLDLPIAHGLQLS